MSFDPATSEQAIEVRDVGKCYQVYSRPQDRLKQALFRWRKVSYFREFWALRHVNLDVARGECVGIIGRNGSGKSTLLQIIAGVLRPTEGTMQTQGRVAALLELGSGFNTEFTGRENVYTNAAVLGISQEEIDERFEEITAFSEIGEFIDQPIKTYSSGMVVRLAFAVQVLMQPDILIVDEALSVGDEAFQRKCFAWLERFRASGGTTLFVTHSGQLVVQLCNRALLLEHGQMVAIGASKPVVDIYQKLLYGSPEESQWLRSDLQRVGGRAEELVLTSSRTIAKGEPAPESTNKSSAFYDNQMMRPPEVSYGTGEAEIFDVGMVDEAGSPVNVLTCGQRCTWRYRVRFNARLGGVRFGMMIKTTQGVDVAGISSVHLEPGRRVEWIDTGQTVEVDFGLTLNIAPGTYFINSGVCCMRDNEEVYVHRRVDVASIRVVGPDRREIYGLAFLDPKLSYTISAAEALSHA